MYLTGRIAIEDGTPIPHDVLVERVCNTSVRQQVYASPGGDFSMRLGATADSFVDASGSRTSPFGTSPYGATRRNPQVGIPRRDLTDCELRASAHGFQSGIVSLLEFTESSTMMESVDVGAIVMHRVGKVKGTTVSALPYKAPKDAYRAYEKGLEAKKRGQLASAQQFFEKAVELYPKYTSAWFQLGTVLQKKEQRDAARRAYTTAAIADKTFLPAYYSLTLMAFEEQNWTEVLKLTNHMIGVDPMNRAALTDYILDLEPMDNTGAYFYNAMANYNLKRFEEAEKSALQAEHLDLRTRFPGVYLLLAELFARKENYSAAIMQTQTYLDLLPQAKDAEQVRKRLAELEQLNGAPPTARTTDPR